MLAFQSSKALGNEQKKCKRLGAIFRFCKVGGIQCTKQSDLQGCRASTIKIIKQDFKDANVVRKVL